MTRAFFVALCGLISTTLASGWTGIDSTHYGTILFEVKHPESPHTSYLFGTHHAFNQSFFDSLHSARQALTSCNLLIKENLNLPGQTASDIINSRETMTDWKSYLGKQESLFVRELFSKSPTDINKLTPAELFAFLTRHYKKQVCLAGQSTDSSLTLDDYIGSMASSNGIKLVGLETTADQIKLLNEDIAGMPAKIHKKRLTAIISQIQQENFGGCGELDWYRAMKMDYQLDVPCSNSLLLTDRNIKWMSQIEPYLTSSNCFIAVGLSHLMYECGLINQLRNLGYTVTPINVT